MRFSEYVARNENVSLKDAIPWLQLIYFNAHDWDADDSMQNVLHAKRKYVISDLLENNINNDVIKGELVYDYICDDEGNPCAVDPDTEEFATVLNLDGSHVNMISLIKHLVKDIGDASLIPDELLGIAGIEVPDKKMFKFFVKQNELESQKNMTGKLVTIGSYSTPYEANIVKSQLESAGIPTFVADEHTIGMNWLYSNALGGVKVQVPESLASEAQELLASEFESPPANDFTLATCPQCGSNLTEDFMDKRGSFLTWVLLGLPLLLPLKKKICRACGHRW